MENTGKNEPRSSHLLTTQGDGLSRQAISCQQLVVEGRPLAVATHPVTRSLWHEIMHGRPSTELSDPKLPIAGVGCLEIATFLRKLRHHTGMSWRLPTAPEWIAACGKDCPLEGNFNSEGLVPIGSYPPNALGLFDMAGNCWELTSTPVGDEEADTDIAMGGSFEVSWEDYDAELGDRAGRVAELQDAVDGPREDVGFRVVANIL